MKALIPEEAKAQAAGRVGGVRNNPELKAQMEAIGESDRMTLKFRKPE